VACHIFYLSAVVECLFAASFYINAIGSTRWGLLADMDISIRLQILNLLKDLQKKSREHKRHLAACGKYL
jgi:hypothetical protein